LYAGWRLLLFSSVWMALLAGSPGPVRADSKNFDWSGKLYTKYLYRNDDTQGVIWLGNPFWYDDIAGNNGIASELELGIKGNVSRYVQVGVKLKSRFGGVWQDWWESGERKWEYLGEQNTSGDSGGMNLGQYLKFRGFFVDINPNWVKRNWAIVDELRVGASDFGMFNEWTIGRVRYIDKDNGRGVFLKGGNLDGLFRYDLAAIALPKLWVGPGWSTGVGDDKIDYAFITQDWAYAGKLETRPIDWFHFAAVTAYTRDIEFDRWDPDAKGSKAAGCKDAMGDDIPGCNLDHAVGSYPRYTSWNTTFEAEFQPGDLFYADLLLGLSYSDVTEDYTSNGVAENGGMFPIIYDDVWDLSFRGRIYLENIRNTGLTVKLEGFYIGDEWNAIFGSRREADVLLTDGFIEGGQLPTLNLANEFVDFDEMFYESCIGWAGITGILGWQYESTQLSLEGTYLDFATDAQGRNIDDTYPTFLYSEGYTDTDLYDYANISDRGRDPRSVYKRDQDRWSLIVVLKAIQEFDFGLKLEGKFKYIRDDDWRLTYVPDSDELFPNDNYLGNILTGRLKISQQIPKTGFRIGAGVQLDWWKEKNRSGDLSGGYGDYLTKKVKPFVSIGYAWGGAVINFYIEYIYKDQDRPAELNLEDQVWKVWRSKATLDVAW
jgi:hypothetical protein